MFSYLYVCGNYTAYSAAWLTTREHVIGVKSETFNLTWVNCEMASFIHMKDSNNFYKNPQGKGLGYFIVESSVSPWRHRCLFFVSFFFVF